MGFKLLICPECKEELRTIGYQVWGTWRFNTKSEKYEEYTFQKEVEVICPPCGARLRELPSWLGEIQS